jgi:hypothetical protein
VTDFACTHDTPLTIANMPERFSPNIHYLGPRERHPSGDYFVVSGLHGRKFALDGGPATEPRQRVEAIPAGTALTGELRLFNVTPAELGGLLAALGCDPASALKLGGGKTHGFGQVRCAPRYELHGGAIDPAAWRRAFLASRDRWSDGEARLIALSSGAR